MRALRGNDVVIPVAMENTAMCCKVALVSCKWIGAVENRKEIWQQVDEHSAGLEKAAAVTRGRGIIQTGLGVNKSHGANDSAVVDQRVPNNRSPASPRPGRMYPCSFNSRSREAQNTCTSGCAWERRRTPCGAATRQRKRIRDAPACLSDATAAAALPPVASMGSSRKKSRSEASPGTLK